MKKFALFVGCIMMLWATTAVNAYNIDERDARNIAATQIASARGEKLVDFSDIRLVKKYINPATNEVALFVFAVNSNAYAVVSGSMSSRPVLAYSTESSISAEAIENNTALASWLQGYADMISEAQNENLPRDERYVAEWSSLMDCVPLKKMAPKSTTVKNLMSTSWSQSNPYNTKCPIYSGGNRSVVGCVALAMGMVMRYWEYPVFGAGTSYPNDVSSTRYTIDFSRAASFKNGVEYDCSPSGYQYDLMPNSLDNAGVSQEQIDATSIFLFHCGMAVRSQYSANATGSSLEYVGEALHDHFKYPSRDLDGYGFYQVERRSVSNDAWIEMLRNEMMAGRPVVYRAADNGNSGDHSGHAFVIDGYKEADGTFHVNWGWGGSGNGHLSMNEIDGLSTTLGSTTYLYSTGQGIILGIVPPADSIHIPLPVAKGIEDAAEASATIDAIYPTPATQYVNIPYNVANGVKQMDIFDAKGVLMKSIAIDEMSGVKQVSVIGFPAGIYTCRMGGASRSFIVK